MMIMSSNATEELKNSEEDHSEDTSSDQQHARPDGRWWWLRRGWYRTSTFLDRDEMLDQLPIIVDALWTGMPAEALVHWLCVTKQLLESCGDAEEVPGEKLSYAQMGAAAAAAGGDGAAV